MFRDDYPDQDPYLGTKSNFNQKNQNQDLKARLYDKGFKQTTMPSVQRPDTIQKNDKVLQARLIPLKQRQFDNHQQKIPSQRQSIALYSQMKIGISSSKNLNSDQKKFKPVSSDDAARDLIKSQAQKIPLQTSNEFFQKGFKVNQDPMKTAKQDDQDQELESGGDIDYHSNMYKTNSMFNLPQLHLKNKGLKSLNVQFSTTAAGNFFDQMAQMMPDPKEFKPVEQKRNKYLIDKLSGKFNIEPRYQEMVDLMDGRVKSTKLKSIIELPSKEDKKKELKTQPELRRAPSKLDTYIDLILKNISNIEEYIYLVKKNDDDPYDLSVETYEQIRTLEREKALKEYYIMSKQGLCYYVNNKPVEFIKLAHWLKERENYDAIKGLQFFTKFRKWKTLKMWKRNVIRTKSQHYAKQLNEKLFILNPILRKTLISFRSNTVQMMLQLKFIETENKENSYNSENTFNLEEFKQLQEKKKKTVMEQIQEYSKKCRMIVRNGFEESLAGLKKSHQQAQTEENDFSGENKQNQNIFRIKETAYEQLGFSDNMSYEKRSELRKVCSMFLRFAYLVDFMAMESLSNIFILSVQQLEDKFKSLTESNDIFIVKDPQLKGTSPYEDPLFEIYIESENIDNYRIDESQFKYEVIKAYMPPPFGNDSIEKFNPLYHVQLQKIVENEDQVDADTDAIPKEEPTEEIEYNRRIVPNITDLWLEMKPNRELFFRELQMCIQQGVQSLQYFERWSKHDDMSKYVMVLEEWDDMVGDNWETPDATYLNITDWLENSPTEIFQATFKNLLDKAFDKCQDWIKTAFHKFLLQFWENNQIDIEIYKNELLENPGDSFLYTLQKLHILKDEFALEIPCQVDIGLFRIDTQKLRDILKPSPEELINKFQEFMPIMIKDNVIRISTWMEDGKKKLKSGGGQSIDSFVQRNIFLKEIQKGIPAKKKKFSTLEHIQEIYKEFKFEVKKDDADLLLKTRDNIKKLEETIYEAEEGTERFTEQYARQVKNNLIPELIKQTQELESLIKHPDYINGTKDQETAIKELTAYHERMLSCEQESLRIKKYEQTLQMDPTKFEDLEDLKVYSTQLLQMYTGSREWKQIILSLLDTPFQQIQTETIKEKAETYTKIVNKCIRSLPPNDILQAFKDNVNDFKNAMPIVRALRNENLQTSHWNSIFEIIKQHINVNDENFKLRNLIEMNIVGYVDEIKDISTQATQEELLKKQHEKIKTQWQTVMIYGIEPVSIKKNDQSRILTGVSDLNTELDALMAEINNVISSRFCKNIRQAAEQTAEEILLAIEVIEDILIVQKNWMYLVNIFNDNETMKSQLKEESDRFANVHKQFVGKMRALKIPLAVKQFIKTSADKILFANMKNDLNSIQKALDQLLFKKRKDFPRFYFLSNDELLEMLANSSIASIQKNIKKCFDGIGKLALVPNGHNILGMISPEGEEITFMGQSLKIAGDIETWLSSVEKDGMKATLKRMIKKAQKDYETAETRALWVKSQKAQIAACVCNIQWTLYTEQLLQPLEDDPSGLSNWLITNQMYLEELTLLITQGELDKIQHLSIIALITQDVHARDIIEEMVKNDVCHVNDFLWQKQLRYYIEEDSEGTCIVRQVNATIRYGYEYMGATTRLVITPLTDRCWMTITGALQIKLGAAPAGPAGTGKTESTKDLGKALGMLCIVFNCSDQIEFKLMAKLFAGLSEQGAWACLDEFNRIDIEVLSVVAQQLNQIKDAMQTDQKEFFFSDLNTKITLKQEGYGVFITMNPGYAGRTELPDNLKVLFRPVSMMIPDYGLIAEIMLFAEGFKAAKVLSVKMRQLYKLSSEQLSQQYHYDFGMRAVKSVLNMAGNLKRKFQDMKEEVVLIRAMRDSNVPKFLKQDLPLFAALINDLFPNVEIPQPNYGKLPYQIDLSIQAKKLQLKKVEGDADADQLKLKVIQLYETFNVRFGVMLVGATTSGKTTCYEILQHAMIELAKQEEQEFVQKRQFHEVVTSIMNPKCISMGELYGYVNIFSQEWTDGLASKIMREASSMDDEVRRWIVFDGPVDALWIENMNTVLDDNMMLCLANGQRIKLRSQMRMLFEVQDLRVASPATVSRCGMVYLMYEDLGWRPFVKSWIDRVFGPREVIKDGQTTEEEPLNSEQRFQLINLFENNIDPAISLIRGKMSEPIVTCDMQLVISLCNVFECFYFDLNPTFLKTAKPDEKKRFINFVFVFSYVWSIAISVKEQYYSKFDDFIKNQFQSVIFPNQDTVYSYYLDFQEGELTFKHWKEKTPDFVYDIEQQFFDILVPTIDTVRYSFILEYLLARQKNVYLTGASGTGKSVILSKCLVDIKQPRSIEHFTLIFSSQTSSAITQSSFQTKLKNLSREEIGSFAGTQMAVMIDDINMPLVEEYGAQPPIELLRLIVDKKGFYDRKDWVWKRIVNTVLVICSAPPEGGRNNITTRFTRHFNILNLPQPSYDVLQKIFESMLKGFFEANSFPDAVRQSVSGIVAGTIDMYQDISKEMKPIPSKFHYTFNLRDVSKVFQGIMMVNSDSIRDDQTVAKLWIHEVSRVFHDRLINDKDTNWFQDKIMELLGRHVKSKLDKEAIFGSKKILFSDILRLEFDKRYELVTNMDKVKSTLTDKQSDYNMESSNQMNLVFFEACVEHILRIGRVLKQPRGNAMLIGVGGSGKQSLTRLSSFMLEYSLLGIEIKKNYGITEFREDIKKFMIEAGCQQNLMDKGKTFIFIDTQIQVEGFLEDINNILNSGEVPNLWQPDEKSNLVNDNREYNEKKLKRAGDTDTVYKTFVERVRNNLHIILCMSPVGDALRIRCRKFPSLVDCCALDWFSGWPDVALISVAKSLIGDDVNFPPSITFQKDVLIENIAQMCKVVHMAASDMADIFEQALKRKVYTTPKSYLDLIKLYQQALKNKRNEMKIQQDRLRNGLTKLDNANALISELQITLTELEPKLLQRSIEVETAMEQVNLEKSGAEKIKAFVTDEAEKVQEQQEQIQEIADEANLELSKVLPLLEQAAADLEKIDKSQLNTLKTLGKPPKQAQMVFEVVCILFGEKNTEWKTAQLLMKDVPSFMKRLQEFDKENMSKKIKQQLKEKVNKEEFDVESIRKAVPYVADIAKFCKAMDYFAGVNETVKPKQEEVKKLNLQLEKANQELAFKKAELKKVEDKVAQLQATLQQQVRDKQYLEDTKSNTARQLINAEKLIRLTKDEAERWKSIVSTLDIQIEALFGDVFLSVGAISYNGPFTSIYRNDLMDQWTQKIIEYKIPISENEMKQNVVIKTLGDPMQLREWMIQGLPSDDSSQENSIFATKGYRWPLLIDPQLQANKWIRKMEASNLIVTRFTNPKFNSEMESQIKNGYPVLIEDVDDQLAPSLDTVLSKAFYVKDDLTYIKFQDKEIPYSNDFRVYLNTKKPNPNYLAEVFIKVNVINFTATFEGLNDQLLGQVVKNEKPEIEQSRDQNVRDLAGFRKKIIESEKDILKLLAEANEATILDNVALISTLENSQITSKEIKIKIAQSQIEEKEIEKIRFQYNVVSVRGSILFFVIKDLSLIDPMYQYSLQYITKLFVLALKNADQATPVGDEEKELQERLDNCIHSITQIIYTNVCRGLFEKDKLIFSFLISSSINKQSKILQDIEFSVFLRGAGVVDRTKNPANPDKNMFSNVAWDIVIFLDNNVEVFKGLAKSIASKLKLWIDFQNEVDPRKAIIPDGWDEKFSIFQKMLIIKIFRPEKLMFSIADYVLHYLGKFYLESPQTSMDKLYDASDVCTPIIFVLSSGADPTAAIDNFASITNMKKQLQYISLGQGQGEKAKILMNKGMKEGFWVFLQNCHLAKSFMPQLEEHLNLIAEIYQQFGLMDIPSRMNQVVQEQIVENNSEQPQQQDEKEKKDQDTIKYEPIHPDFRMFLTSMPAAYFPVQVLQNGIKLTTEPPRGIRANLKRSWGNISQEELDSCVKKEVFNKLIWGLTFFHAIIQERRKFGPLGWNIRYEFNDSDIETAKIVMKKLLEDSEQIPWDSLLFVNGQINYGGRVTDDWDRRCLVTILKKFYNPDILNGEYQFSESSIYKIPILNDISSYRDIVENLPLQEDPSIFGMHENANITYQQQESDKMLFTILSIQPRVGGGGGGMNSDETVLELSNNILSGLPEDLEKQNGNKEMFEVNPQGLIPSLSTVLLQEMEKFNRLLNQIRKSLKNLKQAIAGEIVMSAELDQTYYTMLNNQVPTLWEKVAYPSLKPLGSWILDLLERVSVMGDWLVNGQPTCFWMSGMFFPQGFLTGVLQTHSRKYTLAIDTLTFNFKILEYDKEACTIKPLDGVYIYGLYMEGGQWDKKKKTVVDSSPGQMYFQMPVIQFTPVEEKVRQKKIEELDLEEKTYQCPVYKTSVRAGLLSTTGQSTNFVLPVVFSYILIIKDIPTEEKVPETWILRGTALLCQLNE